VTFDELLLEKHQSIDQVIQDLARRHHLSSAEIEEFRGAVSRALERNDYELLRAFDGRQTWATYLRTVITREFFTFQLALWGQWRPTPTAVRLGPAAMLLEELMSRDRFSVTDAIDWMRTTHRVDLPRHRLMEMAEQLGLSATKPEAHAGVARVSVDTRMRAALADALALLTPDDRLILELRFRERQPLTRIAAIMKLDVRPLQRRIDTAADVVRKSLLMQGVEVSDVEAMFAGADVGTTASPHKWWHLVTARPSKER
jgi:hypothetical protein